jgi:hypothetical protein
VPQADSQEIDKAQSGEGAMSKFEIVKHGVDSPDYFQGCGVAFTQYDFCVTGAGLDAKEAYEDAVEQIYMAHGDEADKLKLPVRPLGIRKKDCVPAE